MKNKLLLKRIFLYLSSYKWKLCVLGILIIISNAFMMAGPMLSGKAIDSIGVEQGKVDFYGVIYYCTIMLLLYVSASIMNYIISITMVKIGKDISYTMRKDIHDKLLKLSVSYFDSKQIGDIISNVSYDVDTLNTCITNDIIQIITSGVTLMIAAYMMLRISPILILVFCITIPLSVLMVKYRLKITKPLFRLRTRKLGELNGFTEDILSGLITIKAYGQKKNTIQRFNEKNEETCETYYKAEYQGALMGPIMIFINNLSMAFLGVFGAFLYVAGKITVGNLSAFVLYFRKFVGPINEFANITTEIQSALSAANRIFCMLDEAEETEDLPGAVMLEKAKGNVEFRKVCFGYSPEKPVLKNLNLEIQSGNIVAIVGATGSGKSTIINLLMRFYDSCEGSITIDGRDIKAYQRESLRKAFSMVLQETWIFHGTIYENISYGTPGASPEQVKEAAQRARIDDFIEAMPGGYDTIVSDNGTNLSKGQKQLITIARAMLQDTSMLILDEATSNVDSRTEQQIQEAMLSFMKGKTCFVIAHRLSTIQHADHILVLKDGNIAEQGTHGELITQNGIYAGLYQAQFE